MSQLAPIINRIAENVEQTVMGITPGGDFNCALFHEEPAQLPTSPYTGLAMIRRGKPTRITESVPSGWEMWDQPFEILVNLCSGQTETEPIDARLAVFTADITRAFRKDFRRGGLAIDTSVAVPDDYISPEGTAYVVATVTVRYRTLWDDPYTGNA